MAIIIENLNMPSTCTMCWISNICQDHIHDLTHIGYEKRLDDCPLREVVRCKDCVHYQPSLFGERKMCFRKDVDGVQICYDFSPDDYCSYGERREDE